MRRFYSPPIGHRGVDAGVSPSSNQVCYMIAIIRRVTAPQNAASPTINASVSTSGAPKGVSRLLFFGAPASVRPICFSIIINFLSSTSLGACADRLATLHVCRFSEQSDRPLDRIEDAGDSCDVKPERYALARKPATRQ